MQIDTRTPPQPLNVEPGTHRSRCLWAGLWAMLFLCASAGAANGSELIAPDRHGSAVTRRIERLAAQVDKPGQAMALPSRHFRREGAPAASSIAAWIYIESGQLWQVRADGDAPSSPRRVGRLTGVCRIHAVRALEADASDAWIEVQVAGPQDFCAAPSGGRRVWARLAAGSQVGPSEPPAVMDRLDWLGDEHGNTRALVRAMDGQLEILEPRSLAGLGWVQGVTRFDEARPLARLAASLSSWWLIDGRLHRLDWDGGQPRLSAARTTAPIAMDQEAHLIAGDELFLQAAEQWLCVPREGPARPLLSLARDEQVIAAYRHADHLLLQTTRPEAGPDAAPYRWTVLHRSGGAPWSIDDEPAQILVHLGITKQGEALFLRRPIPTAADASRAPVGRIERYDMATGQMHVVAPIVDSVLPSFDAPDDSALRSLSSLVYRVPRVPGARAGAGRFWLYRHGEGPGALLVHSPRGTRLTRVIVPM